MLYLAILLGGAIGGMLRYLLSFATNVIPGMSAPLVILVINLSGAGLLGLLYATAQFRRIHPVLHKGLGVGVLGAFTTYSTFCLQTTTLASSHLFLAVLYTVVSMLGGPAFAFLGEKVTVLWFSRTEPTTEEWPA